MLENDLENLDDSSLILHHLGGSFVHAQIVEIEENDYINSNTSVGLFVMPLAAVYVLEDRWIFGDILCRFWVTADLTLCTASILNLCAISVDRHLAVTSAHFNVSQNRVYQIYATIIAFWGPSLIMVIVYVKLWSAAKRMHRQDQLVLRWQGVHLPSDGDLEDGLPPTTTTSNATKSLFRNDSIARANARFLFALRMSAQKFGYYDHQNNKTNGGEIINDDENLRIEVRTSASSSGGGGGGSSTLGTLRVPIVLIIMSAFIICWVPFFILALAKSQHWVNYVPRWLDSLTLWLGYSN
uniref:G-protein coupled receptors family 1 profile domain-containing protein n=1 Tax=Meloidogyne javanica TaxID=6303 RepID=A0A915MMJ8_MELJA